MAKRIERATRYGLSLTPMGISSMLAPGGSRVCKLTSSVQQADPQSHRVELLTFRGAARRQGIDVDMRQAHALARHLGVIRPVTEPHPHDGGSEGVLRPFRHQAGHAGVLRRRRPRRPDR